MTVALLCAVVQGAWAQTEVGTEEALKEAIKWGGNGSYGPKSAKLAADITLSSRLDIVNGNNVTLDLNGHNLSRSLSSAADDGSVILVETGGQLTVKDSGNNSGQITGGKAIDGGGICNHGTLTIEGGTITDCYAQNCGGGIFNAPSATSGAASMTLKGGRITGNTCGDRGAGVFNYSGCTLNIQGTVDVSGNTKGSEANNLYLDGESVINVTGALTGSHIGVSIEQSGRTITKDYKKYNPTADGATFFSSDNSQFGIAQNGDEMAIGTLVTFNVRSWDEVNKQVVTTQDTKACMLLEGSHPDDWIGLTNGYYVVNSGTTEYNVLNILGNDVHLILANSAVLLCAHVKLEGENKLHIHDVSNDNTGRLEVVNVESYVSYGSRGYGRRTYRTTIRTGIYLGAAALGGGEDASMGSLYVHGGTVYAEQGGRGAAIGGGYQAGIGGEMVVYAGTVEALLKSGESNLGAAIGGGYDHNQGGPVTIYGGKVSAIADRNGYCGAGIGGGQRGNGGTVTIWGGEVFALGGKHSAGIGGGYDKGAGGDVHIFGGTVEARGGNKSSAIGSYDDNDLGSIEFADKLIVTGGYDEYKEGIHTTNPTIERVFTSSEREGACLWRRWVRIEPCDHTAPTVGSDHTEAISYTYAGGDTHIMQCRYCGYKEEQPHDFGENNSQPCVCGKQFNVDANMWDVTLHRTTAAGSTSYADRTMMKVLKGQKFTVPAVNATQGLRLMGYVKADEAPAGVALLESEQASLIKVGDVIDVTADMNLYPRYTYVFKNEWTWNLDGETPSATVTLSHAALSDVTFASTGADPQVTITTTELKETVTVIDEEEQESEEEITIGTRYTATCTYTLNGYAYTFTSIYDDIPVYVVLQDGDDNDETLNQYHNEDVDVILYDRTLYKDGGWNTICLPFNLSEEQLASDACPLKDATIKTLDSSSFADGTLTLNFKDASSIVAGMPYIVKWKSGDNITAPVFTDVIISATETQAIKTTSTYFVGSFSPVSLTGGDKSVLYLGAGNKLYYPSADMTIGSCRAYFKLKGITAGDITSGAIELNFGEDEATGVREVKEVREVKDNSWYTLDGRRISVPSATSVPSVLPKGVYINNGKKIIIK